MSVGVTEIASLRQLAKVLSVSHAFLSQIRNGKRPLPEALKAKAEALGAYQLLTTLLTSKHHSGRDDMERETGLEPATTCLEGRSSTRLSYSRSQHGLNYSMGTVQVNGYAFGAVDSP